MTIWGHIQLIVFENLEGFGKMNTELLTFTFLKFFPLGKIVNCLFFSNKR